MEGEHGKIDTISPSLVTPFKPGKRSPGLSLDINTYSSRHDHETPDVNYLLSSIIICGRHHFFHLF